MFNPRQDHLGKTRVVLVGLRIPSRPGVSGGWQVRLISPETDGFHLTALTPSLVCLDSSFEILKLPVHVFV